MGSNSFGTHFRLTTFGESHGPAVGAVIDGCPAGLQLDLNRIQNELDRRRPGQSALTTQRKEQDRIEILSGVFDGVTLGTPIGMLIRNADVRSEDYNHITQTFRPSHADYSWNAKYGIRDHRGGGRSSARETATWVAGGAIARQLILRQGVTIRAFVNRVGECALSLPADNLDLEGVDDSPVRCPDPETAERMIELIQEVRKDGDTVGGEITCIVQGCPPGWGGPIFHKLQADLAHAMLTINACKGFEYGSGFSGAKMRGSTHNDPFVVEKGVVRTATNFSGGIQGGITNGMDIVFRLAFKPVATIMRAQNTVNDLNEEVTVSGKGRHDPCVVPRAVPIVEALTALVLADHSLLRRLDQVE